MVEEFNVPMHWIPILKRILSAWHVLALDAKVVLFMELNICMFPPRITDTKSFYLFFSEYGNVAFAVHLRQCFVGEQHIFVLTVIQDKKIMIT